MPDGARVGVAAAIRQVRLAAVAVLALGAVALPEPARSDMPAHLAALWFALPFVLGLSCPAIARVEIHPYARWASPAGQRLLAAPVRHIGDESDRRYLTTVAVRGVRALGEPELRAVFAPREPHRQAPPRPDDPWNR